MFGSLIRYVRQHRCEPFSLKTFAAGMLSQMAVNQVKYSASLAIWGLYALILVLHKLGFAPPRRLALFTVSGFVLVLLSLPGIQYLSSRP